ncbi:MAG: RHS repeat-associated core domain-containing protein, partial [Phycisphaerae bacterium]
RYYSPEIGRWTQRDPAGAVGRLNLYPYVPSDWMGYPEIGRFTRRDPAVMVDGLNLYGYAGNDPVGWIDPDGRKKIKVQTYRAIFRQNVSVVQQDRLKTTGQLTADRLELLFDFGPQQRRFSAVEPTTRPRGSPGRPARSDQTRIVVTWSGPMEMRPVAASPAEQTGDRFEVIAVGQPVRVADRQGQAICSKLVFHNQSERVWLYGSAEQPVEMSSGPNRRLVGQLVFFDRRRGIARIEGPGRMTDVRQQPPPLELGRARRYRPDRDRKPVQVRWSGGVELALGRQTLRRRLPEGRTVLRVRQYIERADFTGAVQMTQADQSIAADRITLDFAAPTADQRLPETIRRLRAGGNVILLRRYDRISCQSLVVQMGLDEAGRSVPRKAHALGQVVARQGQRVIRADEMIATIGPVAGQPGAGQDVGRQLAITELQAYRQVAVHDPDQSLDVAAEELHCKLTGGRQIETALVVGRPGDDAQVRLGDYQLRAARINIDLTSQRADVNCPGQLRFVTRQD